MQMRTHHVAAPAELARDQDARRVADTVGDDDLLDLIAKSLLDGLAEVLELLSLLLARLLLLSDLSTPLRWA